MEWHTVPFCQAVKELLANYGKSTHSLSREQWGLSGEVLKWLYKGGLEILATYGCTFWWTGTTRMRDSLISSQRLTLLAPYIEWEYAQADLQNTAEYQGTTVFPDGSKISGRVGACVAIFDKGRLAREHSYSLRHILHTAYAHNPG